jgi:very-short-patch-repair endonuclease
LDDRNALLDLGTRNRLIHVPLRTKNIRAIEIVDERSAEVFRLLSDGKRFTFKPGRTRSAEEKLNPAGEIAETESDEEGAIPQPSDDATDDRGVAKRHSDTQLQTRLTSEGLQKRLLDIWYDARTLEEEQGVNILYLGLGLLKWFEDDKSDVERLAPLLLLPVRLERTSAADRFHLTWRAEPPSPNLSLQAKMNAEFGLKIEDFGDEDDVDLEAYMAKVADTVSRKARWAVQADAMVLGFFSFAKFLMYRDLDPENWPAEGALDQHPTIRGLLQDGFEAHAPIVADDGNIDPVILPIAMHHVIDADSSQTVAIEEVARGRHLVIKGPPGTGKSQTITNIIAAAAAQGRKVLFVAEKMAALDVVHRRLRDAGLAPLALELHSNKVNKKAVLEELKRTKGLATRAQQSDTTIIQRLTDARDQLNMHASMMHMAHEPSTLTPFRLLGQLVRTRAASGKPGYSLVTPEVWSPLDLEKRRELLDEIVARLDADGMPHEHPWRGVQRDALDPSEMEALLTMLDNVSSDLAEALRMCAQAASAYGLERPEMFADLAGCLAVLDAAVTLPNCDRKSLESSVWERLDDVAEVVERGEKFTRLKTAVDSAFSEGAWDASLNACRTIIAEKGRSIFRILSGEYRSQLALFRSYLKVPLPKAAEQRLLLVDGLIGAQNARRAFRDLEEVGTAAFGANWRKERSNWAELRRLTSWWSDHGVGSSPKEVRERLVREPLSKENEQALADLRMRLPRLREEFAKLIDFLKLDLTRAFAVESDLDFPLESLRGRLEAWKREPERITKWISFIDRVRLAQDWGLQSLIAGLMNGDLQQQDLISTFDRSYYEAMRTQIFSRHPELRKFDGEVHTRLVDNFRKLDLMRMNLAREKIAYEHAAGIPRNAGGIGPLGVLNGEFAKKRNHLPIRQLLERAAPVIQQLKPIFLMSPLSVAQFLKPGAISFDLLVVDEASQIEPVDALGAIARCQQIVVVGDERQLPPTRFFAKLTGNVEERDEDDEATFQARDAESILDLCLAKGLSHRMLNWHYRSKHQSLIAVSNKEFYDNRLFIVPSPYDAVAGMGLKFNYLPDAHYDRGNTRTNPEEARAVAEAVMRHAREVPDKSLGVATFSVAQRQAILNELELLRRDNPDVEEFFSRGTSEPFFVKNLENIQGDERDVIFISLGYGRTSTGYIAMSFGPLNSDGGERRLNVLISRAKLRCEVFSSITGDDIDLERSRGKGVAALKMFLSFAQTGKLGIAEVSGREADSVFEEQVAARLAALGYDVKMQIGTAGFFVDLAISDPDKPGRFVLGIECDGAQYHSSRSARDRDRLRQNVLEAHGWIIHRIWSTDWFLRPNEELVKVRTAIDAAKARWRELEEEATNPRAAVPLRFKSHEDGDVDVVTGYVTTDVEESISMAYEEAKLVVRQQVEPHETPLADMAKHVARIVEIEGPIHESEIVVRIRSAWGLARAGNRIRDAVQSAIDAAKRKGTIIGGPFYSLPGQDVSVRSRANVASPSLRKPECLPPEEIKAAIVTIVGKNFGAEREQLILAVARALGFASTSSQLRSVIEAAIGELIEGKKLNMDGSLLAPL